MKRTGSRAVFFIVLLIGLTAGSFSSFNVTSAGKITATVTYNYYVVAGFNITPSPPPVPPSPAGFNFACTPDVFNFGNITKWGGRTYIYDGLVDSPYEAAHGYTGARMNITNLLGYDITITNLTAEVTAGTPTLEYWFNPAGRYFGNFTVVWFDALDAWLESTPPDYRYLEDECNYTTGEVAVRRLIDGDGRTKAVGSPYPEGFQSGTGSLLEPDWLGDAEATGHVAPIALANGATFTEYFGVAIFGDVDVGTQINGTITLSLTYEYAMPGSPVASFTHSPTDLTVDETVTFNASTSTPDGGNLTDPDSYVWDFGDETNGTGMIVNHTYTAPGTYAIVLNVTDSDGKWNYASDSVTVRPLPTTILVPDNFSTIQEAINNAYGGDTIFVRAGTYYENVVVNKSVWLVGENKETTVIDGKMSGTAVEVRVNDVLVTNFTIRNGGNFTVFGSGMLVEGEGATIIDNVITKNFFGIYLLDSVNSVISKNNVTNNDYGAALYLSPNITVSGNDVSNNSWGIMLMDCPNSAVSGNTMNGNNYGFFTYGDPALSIDVSNLVDGRPVYYLVNQKDLVINSSTHPTVGYLALVNCSNMAVEGLTLTNSATGLSITYTNSSRVVGNNITDNYFGIWLDSSFNNTMNGNYVGNRDGIWLDSSSNNFFYHNSFVNNVSQVVSDASSANVWDNGYPSGGNYWIDYAGLDEKIGSNQDQPGSDGICDTPYVIDESNRDRYPVMNPWHWTPPLCTLTVNSSPEGVTFWITPGSVTTPWSRTYVEGASVLLYMPRIFNGYVWSHWLEDGDTNNVKTVAVNTNITLTAVYTSAPPLEVAWSEDATHYYGNYTAEVFMAIGGAVETSVLWTKEFAEEIANQTDHIVHIVDVRVGMTLVWWELSHSSDPSNRIFPGRWTWGRWTPEQLNISFTPIACYDRLKEAEGMAVYNGSIPADWLQVDWSFEAWEYYWNPGEWYYDIPDQPDMMETLRLEADDNATEFCVMFANATTKAEEIAIATDRVVDLIDLRMAVTTVFREQYPNRYIMWEVAWARLEACEEIAGFTYDCYERMFPIEMSGSTFYVASFSNSTVGEVTFYELENKVCFNVTGPDGTLGFCNVTILTNLIQDLWQNNFTVLIDGEQPLTIWNCTDGTYTYIYFTYLHSEHEVTIIPEFSSFLLLPLFIITTLLTVAYAKKRKKQ